MKRLLLLVLMLSPFLLSAAPQADYEKEFVTMQGKKLDIDLKTERGGSGNGGKPVGCVSRVPLHGVAASPKRRYTA